jgi:hypothetical protein
MELIKFKLESDVFDEHHLQNILYKFYNGERYYYTNMSKLFVEGYDPVYIEDGFIATIKDNLIYNKEFSISKIKFTSSTISIEEYKEINEYPGPGYLYKDKYQVVNNMLYYMYYEPSHIMIAIINTDDGSIWELTIKKLPGLRDLFFHSNKIILIFPNNIYIINMDGTYWDIIVSADDIITFNINILYLYSSTNELTTMDLNNPKIYSIRPVDFEGIKHFFVTDDKTILIFDTQIKIYGLKNYIIDVKDLKSSEENSYFSEFKVNKSGSKLITIMSTNFYISTYYFVIINLNSGQIEYSTKLEDFGKIGFLDININQNLPDGVKDIIVQKPIKVETQLLGVIKLY